MNEEKQMQIEKMFTAKKVLEASTSLNWGKHTEIVLDLWNRYRTKYFWKENRHIFAGIQNINAYIILNFRNDSKNKITEMEAWIEDYENTDLELTSIELICKNDCLICIHVKQQDTCPPMTYMVQGPWMHSRLGDYGGTDYVWIAALLPEYYMFTCGTFSTKAW